MGSASAKADTSLRLGSQIPCKFSVLNLPPPSLTPAGPETMVRPTSGGVGSVRRARGAGFRHGDKRFARRCWQRFRRSQGRRTFRQAPAPRKAARQRPGHRAAAGGCRRVQQQRTVCDGQGLPSLDGVHGRHHRGCGAWVGDRQLRGDPSLGLMVLTMLGFGAGIWNVMRASGFVRPPPGPGGGDASGT